MGHIVLTKAGSADLELHEAALENFFQTRVHPHVVANSTQLKRAMAETNAVILTSMESVPATADFRRIEVARELRDALDDIYGSMEAAVKPHPLELIFCDAVRQATSGKGERHGGDATPFYDQQWVFQAKVHGNGFLTDQAAKKLTEAVMSGTLETDPEAFEREILGAMVYLGMALLHVRGLPEA